MWSSIAPISSLLGGVALLLLGNGLLNTLLTLRGVAEGYSSTMLGLIMSGYFVGFLIGTWSAIPLISRIGHIRTFAFSAALASVSALLHAVVIDPWFWLVLRVFYGIALVTLYMAIESWLNAQAPGDKRGQIFAVYMTVNLVALALAQQLLSLASPLVFTLFAVASILICCALMPITLTRQAQPALPERPQSNLRHLCRSAPLAVAAAGFSGLAMSAFWGLAPAYANLNGFDSAGVGLLMTSSILGGALLQWPIGLYSDRHDRRLVLFWVAALGTLLALAMSQLTAGPLLLGTIFLWGGLAFSLYPIAVAQMVDQLHPDEILASSSSLLLVNGLGSVAGPLLAGSLMEQFGPAALPLYFALSLAILAGYTLYRLRHVSDLLTEPHGHFAPMLRTSPAVLELMPDAPPQEHEGEPATATAGEEHF